MSQQNKCTFCQQTDADYCCPKCGRKYCSLKCYRSKEHLECSETFYKEWVMQSMQMQDEGDSSKRKMLEILKRQREFESDTQFQDRDEDEENREEGEDEEENDLRRRMDGLDLESEDCSFEDIWKRLTEEERLEFTKMVETGNYPKVYQCGNKLVSLEDD